MKLILLFIIVILLIALFSIRIQRIKGGEFLKYIYGNEKLVPSISQIELADSIHSNVHQRDNINLQIFDYIVSRCVHRLEKISSFSWMSGRAYWTKANEAHLISDAHLDLVGLLISNLQISKALAACEWHGDSFRTENNAIITLYNENGMTMSRGLEQSYMKTAEYLAFTGYFEGNEADAINQAIRIDDKLNMNSVISYYNSLNDDCNLITYDRTYRNDELAELLNRGEQSISSRIRKISRATQAVTSNETSIRKCDRVSAIRNRYPLLLLLREAPNVPTVEIFIEYSYGIGRRANDLFAMIHKHTVRFIKALIEHHQSIKNKRVSDLYIYCYRFQLEGINEIGFPDIDIDAEYTTTNRRIFISIFDECNFNVVQIPKTSSEFSYDEQLFLLINGINYSIQIEHSENGIEHKSNFVEFLGRNLSSYLTVDEIRDFFSHNTHYMNADNQTFNWLYNEEGADINNSVIVNSFGAYRNQLFVPHVVVNTE